MLGQFNISFICADPPYPFNPRSIYFCSVLIRYIREIRVPFITKMTKGWIPA